MDPSVIEEASLVEPRVKELRNHVDDLDAAQRTLKEALRELAAHIRERFTGGLTSMNERFNHYFREVFGGGRASLALVQPRPIEHAFPDLPPEETEERPRATSAEGDEPDEHAHVHELPLGVEIHAHPPGKRVHSLNQLSGGEKALTSIALLCAILRERASPFVVLDEVDAALDEANSRRFAHLLDDMAQRAQCIIITHNRATMEAARSLYGVTMGADGVSQLLSVKLEDAVREAPSPRSAQTVRS
jgi:chromosome segregation protein